MDNGERSIWKDKIDLTSHFYHDLGADSLDVVGLLIALEDEFDIEISDEVAERIETAGDVISMIEDINEQS